MISKEHRAIGGMGMYWANRSFHENLPQCHFVHNKFHTLPGIKPGPSQRVVGD
jgi:hypothetical protein